MPEIAVQLYTLRADLERDFAGTLRAVADLGLRHVELAGQYGGLNPAELRRFLDDIGLSVPSMHISLEALEGQFDAEIERARTLGAQHVVVPWWQADSDAGWRDLQGRLAALLPRVHAVGMGLAYHNHAHELTASLDGRPVLDALLATPGLGAEIDLAWVYTGGHDPAAYLTRHAPRLVHVKDARREGDGWRTVPLGQGEVPLEAALAASQNAEFWILEQDETQGPALENLRTSLDHLKTLVG